MWAWRNGEIYVGVAEVIRVLKSRPLPLSDEKTLQKEISSLFDAHGIQHKREVSLGQGDVIDFMLPGGIGVEAKMGRVSKRLIYRQCKRYCERPQVSALVLVSATAMGFPMQIEGKDCYYVSLGTGWL